MLRQYPGISISNHYYQKIIIKRKTLTFMNIFYVFDLVKRKRLRNINIELNQTRLLCSSTTWHVHFTYIHCKTSTFDFTFYLSVVIGKWQNLNTGQIQSELQPAAVLSHRGRQEQCLLLPGQSQSNLRLGSSQIPKILQKEPTEETIYGLHGDTLRYISLIIELLSIWSVIMCGQVTRRDSQWDGAVLSQRQICTGYQTAQHQHWLIFIKDLKENTWRRKKIFHLRVWAASKFVIVK